MKPEKKDTLINDNKKNNDKVRKSYIPPTLKNYGKVSELTKGASVAASEMGTHKK